MTFYEGMNCPVCSQPFTEKDDIVYCPQCGLPHHRACWHRLGHCAAEQTHNTDQQWSRTTGEHTTANTDEPASEPNHYAEPKNNYNEYKPFRQNEAAHTSYADDDYIDGISANDYAAVVGNKADYYVPRFRRIAVGGNGGWNWAAFFFSPYWLIYRKMYVGGFLLLALNLFETVLTAVVMNVMNITDPQQLYDSLYNMMYNPTGSAQLFYLLSIWIISVIIFVIDILVAIFGNKLYQQHCANVIRKARTRVPDLSAPELTGIGGTTIGVVLISGILMSFIEQLISIVFMISGG